MCIVPLKNNIIFPTDLDDNSFIINTHCNNVLCYIITEISKRLNQLFKHFYPCANMLIIRV